MTERTIKEYLSILNINSLNQLLDNDLDYWHQKRFIEIQRSFREKHLISQKLIELNNAKEYLEEFDLETLKKQFVSNQENISFQSNYFDENFNEEFDEDFVYTNNYKNLHKKNETFSLRLLNFFMIKDPKNIWKLILFFAGLINLIVTVIFSPNTFPFSFVFLILIVAIIAKKKNYPYIDL